jgi:hypothetical protein
MDRVFISSLQRGEMGAIRTAASNAVDSMGMQPVMFETGAAASDSPRNVLLGRVASCDVLLLIVGADYGEPGKSGVSPTEDEVNEARARGIPVLALVQRTTREPAQEEFLARIRGTWEHGLLTADFTDASDVAYAIVKALREWHANRTQAQLTPDLATQPTGSRASADPAPAARDKALALLQAADRPGTISGGSKLRVVVVPVGQTELINALTLRDDTLVNDVAAAARASRLATQSAGIQSEVGRDAIVLNLSTRGYETLALQVGFDGSIVGEGAVGSDDQFFGSSVVVPEHARAMITATLDFAEQAWTRIDENDQVGDVLVASAVPEAEHKVYAIQPVQGHMRVPVNSPRLLIAPEEPLRFSRAELPRAVDRLDAELQRAFELHGAVNTGGGPR